MTDVDLAEFADLLARDAARAVRVSLPGRVGSYDRAQARASVTWGVAFRHGTRGVQTEKPAPACPVITPRGGGYAVSFDLEEGDACVGIVPDRAASFWDDGTVAAPSVALDHNLGAAVVIAGGRLASEDPPHPAGAMLVGAEQAGGAALILRRARTNLESSRVTIRAANGPAPRIELGENAISPNTRADDLIAAIDAAIAAALLAIAGPDGGALAFTAFQSTWNSLKNQIRSSLVYTE